MFLKETRSGLSLRGGLMQTIKKKNKQFDSHKALKIIIVVFIMHPSNDIIDA